MKKNKSLFPFILIFLLVGVITACSTDTMQLNEEPLSVNNATVTSGDLMGYWKLSAMIADTEVDLNDDNIWSTNLLNETSCFNTMDITFNEDGTFITKNATMTFESGAENNKFSCISDRIDNGQWTVRNDSLIMTMEVNAQSFTHSKLINLGSGTFSFDVNKVESNLYVNDPGNTQASSIRILELEYTKQ